jgi:two-component system, chemotaxis family, protein-glutamate methylesterase/glutaminase
LFNSFRNVGEMQDQLNQIRVLIADKQSYARLVLEDILHSDTEISVSGLAGNGDELISLLKCNHTDVVILDLNLPKNNRLFTLKRISNEVATPIVLLVKKEELSLALLKEVLLVGVYAVIIKPGSKRLPDYRSIKEEIILKVKALREVSLWDDKLRMEFIQHHVSPVPDKLLESLYDIDAIVVIGASTGGTQAIEKIIQKLDPGLKITYLVAVHLPVNFTKAFAKRLQVLTPLNVSEGSTGQKLRPNSIIIAPGDKNMVVKQGGEENGAYVIDFSNEPVNSFDRPCIDLLMDSVAKTGIKHIIGVILTGMGKDGTKGAGSIQEKGGIVIAQNKETSAIFGMAKSAIESGSINEVLPLSEIPNYINNCVAQQRLIVSTTGMLHEI